MPHSKQYSFITSQFSQSLWCSYNQLWLCYELNIGHCFQSNTFARCLIFNKHSISEASSASILRQSRTSCTGPLDWARCSSRCFLAWWWKQRPLFICHASLKVRWTKSRKLCQWVIHSHQSPIDLNLFVILLWICSPPPNLPYFQQDRQCNLRFLQHCWWRLKFCGMWIACSLILYLCIVIT